MKNLREKMNSFCKNSEIGNACNMNIGSKLYFFTANKPIKVNLALILSLSVI